VLGLVCRQRVLQLRHIAEGFQRACRARKHRTGARCKGVETDVRCCADRLNGRSMVPQECGHSGSRVSSSVVRPLTVRVARVLVVLQAGRQRMARPHDGVLRQVLHKHLRGGMVGWVDGWTGRQMDGWRWRWASQVTWRVGVERAGERRRVEAAVRDPMLGDSQSNKGGELRACAWRSKTTRRGRRDGDGGSETGSELAKSTAAKDTDQL
jgi:hypothetical protein